MTIERLLEAVLRLAKAGGRPLGNIKIEIDDVFFATPVTIGLSRDKKSHSRQSRISVMEGGWTLIAKADIDLNNMVLSIDYDDKAPWWAVKPFIEAMEGK